MSEAFKRLRVKIGFGAGKRQEFYDVVASFVEDGVPLFDAIAEVHKRYATIGAAAGIVTQEIIMGLRGNGNGMRRVGKVLGQFVPSSEAIAIEAGEQSGDVAKGFRMAAKICKTSNRIASGIVSQMVYPVFLAAMAIGLLVFISVSIIPMMEGVASRASWPLSARVLGVLADGVPLILPALLTLFTAYFAAFSLLKSRMVASRVRDALDRFIFPWGLYCQVSGAMMLAAVSALIAAGIPFTTAIDRLNAASSPWERSRLSRVLLALRKGAPEGDALVKSGFYRDHESWLVSVYGKRSNFAQSMDSLSDKILDSTIAKTNRVFSLVQTLTLIVIATLVAVTYAAFLAIAISAKRSNGL